MNNDIQETHVSIQVAKLLKVYGFDTPCKRCHADDDPRPMPFLGQEHINSKHPYYSAPTQQIAIDWVRVNFGIHVYTYPVAPFVTEDEKYPKLVWISKVCSLRQLNFEKFINTENDLALNHFHTPEEAKEAALEYVLTNLISR